MPYRCECGGSLEGIEVARELVVNISFSVELERKAIAHCNFKAIARIRKYALQVVLDDCFVQLISCNLTLDPVRSHGSCGRAKWGPRTESRHRQ